VVNVNPERMRSYGISPDEIVATLAQANVISPSGNMQLGDKYPLVPTNAVVKNIKDLESVPLRVTSGGGVYVRDVATVDDQSDLVTSYALVNGRRTVYIPVTKRADASTLSVVELVKENLPKFQAVVPEDVKVSYEFDQAPVVRAAIADLVKEGVIGALLTGLMVLLFLRDWRSVIVVVVNIPLSLLAGALALWLTGETINLMTLGGLALAVGVLVDEATVAVENTHTHLAKGESLARAALEATRETAVPRLLAMLCVVAVFIPALFMEGSARALFAPLAMAVGFSMVASYVLSSTLVPILSVWLLRSHGAGVKEMTFGKGFYQGLVKAAIGMRWILIPAYLAVCAAVVVIVGPKLGREIFPTAEHGQFALRMRAPAGTKVELTEGIAKQILGIIDRESGGQVLLTMGLVGVHAPNYPVNLIHLWNGGPEEGLLSIQLKPDAKVDIAALKEKLRSTLSKELPEVRVSFEPSDLVNRVMSFGSPTPIEVAVSGADLMVNRDHALKILERLKQIPSLRDVQIAQELEFPTVDVAINRERAGLLGLRVSDTAKSLVAATTSSRFTVPNYWADSKNGVSYSLQVQIPQSLTQSLEDLKNVPVSTKDGKTSLLRNFASVTPGSAVGQYERYNMARVVSITANLHGASLGEVAEQVKAAITAAGAPPPKTKVDLRGQVVPLTSLMDGLQTGLILAVGVIFLMLLANYQSLRLAMITLCTVPAVIAGVVLALWLTRTTLNLQSFMGAIMAVGVSVANAILLVTFAERFRLKSGNAAEAAIDGAWSRLRPILMTSVAMLAGMTPMALGLGESGPQTSPLGRAVMGGLAASTVATLFILPAAFALVMRKSKTQSASIDPDDPASSHFDLSQTSSTPV
jgi:multidrug efflux pump subunit AcrB